ncbi:t-complex 10 [Vairimorpha ceranae]|uniref:T-complex 10 n=1 Tax=Vairimorpha ceranae TaxID=40302 RepID=A0A0F9YU10_9MICR|nr:t-complex 10 [Vairimorpha ceranae]KAF5141146.1 hypothetical protein G9O61_00g004620 [Vairimorpha ceranae]KKO75962.1 t-complex 10 [Vairimorpha ceranae]
MLKIIKEKINSINRLMEQVESTKKPSIIELLKKEIEKLRELNNEYKNILDSKKVVHKEIEKKKIRYYLQDGSTYVIRDKYRYLYDAKSKVITYEFDNGQIERSYPSGIKEIRYGDGSIIIKNDNKDYDKLDDTKSKFISL